MTVWDDEQVFENTRATARKGGACPEVLVLDVTRIGGQSATGQLKKTLFAGWPAGRLMQVYSQDRGVLGVYHETATGPATRVTVSAKDLMAECQAFAPDVIYYRPVELDMHLHDFALEVIRRLNVPLITHIMDDWPERLRHKRPKLHKKLDASLRDLFSRSYARLSICDEMSIAFRERYGGSFTAVANCIDPCEWTALDRERRRRIGSTDPFLIRYAGALAPDKELQSVLDVARVVDSLQKEGIDVRLEVHTMANWESNLRLFSNLKGVSTDAGFLPRDDYRRWLVGCDALLLAYNFDDKAIVYMRYSMANSLPEAMASAAPIIAYGPAEVATIAYVISQQLAVAVKERDRSKLRSAIMELASDPEYGRQLGNKARELAFKHHNSRTVVNDFHSLLAEAAAAGKNLQSGQRCSSEKWDSLGGPFGRHHRAHIDEGALVAALVGGQRKGGVMVDVGAMHGSALSPFVGQGWRVYAFEPNPDNRKELEKRFGDRPNLTVDGRAVADGMAEGMPFYSSAESPGISSLHPFHESHKQACMVSTTTIADFVRERDLHAIDYLKIDTEGYDLQVLKGVPWDSMKPGVIMCEFEDSKTRSLGYTMHDMARYLNERGYTVLVSEWHPIVRYGIRHDWHRLVSYPCELSDPGAWGNLIAFLDPPDLQRIAAVARSIVKVDAGPTLVRGKLASRLGARFEGMLNRALRSRVVDHLMMRYPTMITVGRFGLWSLGIFRRTLFGIGGIALLIVVGLLVAAALVPPLRWYLVGIAIVLLLIGGGVLALFYIRSLLSSALGDQRTQIQDIKKEVASIKTTVARMNLGNVPLFQQFNRRLTDEEAERLSAAWAPRLGLDLNARALSYIAHRIRLAEDTCIGRLGGNIETMVVRVLVARSVKQANLEVLEIGTLFGVGAAMIHENCRGLFRNTHITVIDPLIGHILLNDRHPAGCLDSSIKVPATREIFIHNMQRMHIPESDYTIIQELSTDDEAIEEASRKRYNLLIIDGDHSDSGVKHDFFKYRHLVKPGGYIFFDDYGNPNWPGLTDFVNNEVSKMPELEFLGTDVFSAVFRVTAPPDSTGHGSSQQE